MSYESSAEPIKVGYLMDFTLPPGFPEELLASFTRCFDLVFEEAVEQGLIDRPVQMIYREVEGLPKGSVKAVIDAFGELVRAAHHRQLRADPRSDRGAVQGAGHRGYGHRRLARRVDVRFPAGIDDG